jgi:hypothetical protein
MDDNTQLVAQLIMQAANKQNARIAAFEALLREMVDEPPIVVGDGGACCAFCGAVYDNPHTEACWIRRVEKALSGEE